MALLVYGVCRLVVATYTTNKAHCILLLGMFGILSYYIIGLLSVGELLKGLVTLSTIVLLSDIRYKII